MEFKYFLISYIEFADGNIKNSDTILYYTSGPTDLNEVKIFIKKDVLKNEAAVITLPSIQRIDKEFFESLGGKTPF